MEVGPLDPHPVRERVWEPSRGIVRSLLIALAVGLVVAAVPLGTWGAILGNTLAVHFALGELIGGLALVYVLIRFYFPIQRLGSGLRDLARVVLHAVSGSGGGGSP